MAEIAKEVEDCFAKEEVRIQSRLHALSSGAPPPQSEQRTEEQRRSRHQEALAAEKRNKLIIRDLDVTVGRLRTRVIYSPTDEVLRSAKVRYLRQIKELRASLEQQDHEGYGIRLQSMPGEQLLDYSFKDLTSLEAMKGEKPRKSWRKTSDGRYIASCLKLNNNQIDHIAGIHSVLLDMIESPLKLTWLDLSFNRLLSIPAEISFLSSLKIFYLHGNHLVDLPLLLNSLKQLEELIGLTLHGNPVEEQKNYKKKVLHALPRLRTLDFSNITQSDRAKLNQSPKTSRRKPVSH